MKFRVQTESYQMQMTKLYKIVMLKLTKSNNRNSIKLYNLALLFHIYCLYYYLTVLPIFANGTLLKYTSRSIC